MIKILSDISRGLQWAALTFTVLILLALEGIFFIIGIGTAFVCGTAVGCLRHLSNVLINDLENL